MASIKRRPDGRWRARYRDPDGREHARHFTRKSDAERWLANIQSDIARGGYRDPAAARTTFKEYADKWRAQQPHRPGTARLYERTLRLHVYLRSALASCARCGGRISRVWSPAW